MKRIGKMMLCLVLIGASLCGAAMADGGEEWLRSMRYGYVRLAEYTGDYDGYVCVDGMGGITSADPYFLTVISKSASVWQEPRTGSRKLTSVSHGDTLMCRMSADRDGILEENGFYAVEYKAGKNASEWRDGWINKDYVVRNNLEIVLMESNVPAYIAPDTSSKKVGSLSKLTRHRVIGIYDDFYIINLRGAAAAFIPMDVRHYDTSFELLHRQAPGFACVTTGKTAVRTGPGEDYPKVEDVKAGHAFEAIDCIDGWYVIRYDEAEGGAFVYIDAAEATAEGESNG